MGLGLTISRGFARAMGGDITAHSVLGAGATFSVALPPGELRETELLPPEALLAEAQNANTPEAWRWEFPAAHVLVVDDGSENRELARVVLEDAGLEVSEAENGRVAVERIGTGRYDLVLMDMQMPEMDGYEATRTLRAQGCTLPIIALTANAMKGFERQIEEAGFSGYLTKPIDIELLLQTLAERLGGRRRAAFETAPHDAPDGAREAAAAAVAAAAEPPPSAPIVSRLAKQAKFAGIVRRFAAQLPAKLAEMEAALQAGELAQLGDLAHWLKGAGGSVGFDDLFEPARQLEEAARAGEAAAARRVIDLLLAMNARIERPVADSTATKEATLP